MKILIVEDEIHIARHLSQMIGRILDEEVEVLHICISLDDALDYMSKKDIDLLMLDLNLSGKDGFEVLKLIVAEPFHVIIVSAHIEKAIEAFEYGVLDFVPKPFSEKRLRKSFERLIGAEKRTPAAMMKNFVIKKKNKLELIKEEEVLFFEAYGHYSKIHLRDQSYEVYDKPLIALESLLDVRFERVHKSYIVKMTEIKNIEVFAGGKYYLRLTNGTKVKLGRDKYKEIKDNWGW